MMCMCEYNTEHLYTIKTDIFCVAALSISFSGSSLHREVNTLCNVFITCRVGTHTEQQLQARCNEKLP
jgi:hypothetical protein